MDASTVTYPMVAWHERTATTTDDDASSGDVVNNFYEEDSDAKSTSLVLTALFCFLGGILVQTGVQFFWGKAQKPPLAASNGVELSSSSSA